MNKNQRLALRKYQQNEQMFSWTDQKEETGLKLQTSQIKERTLLVTL